MQEYCFGRKRAEPSLTPQPEPGRGHGDTGEAALETDRESEENVNIYKLWGMDHHVFYLTQRVTAVCKDTEMWRRTMTFVWRRSGVCVAGTGDWGRERGTRRPSGTAA